MKAEVRGQHSAEALTSEDTCRDRGRGATADVSISSISDDMIVHALAPGGVQKHRNFSYFPLLHQQLQFDLFLLVKDRPEL